MFKNIVKTLRPKQWTKNVVLFAGLVFDRQLGILTSVGRAGLAILIFSLLSGIAYIINDLIDLESDRLHPVKSCRPIASGSLSKKSALIFALILTSVVVPSAFLLSINFGIICLAYLILMLIYSRYLKRIAIVDVMTIAVGFVLRVTAGIVVIKVTYLSPWLFVLTTLLALFLGFGKRRAELVLMLDRAETHRKSLKGYTIPMLDQTITVLLTATLITYSLYTFSATITPESHAMMLTIPFVLYGLLRYLYLIHTENHGGAPEDVLLSDHPLQISILLWGISVVTILYFFIQ